MIRCRVLASILALALLKLSAGTASAQTLYGVTQGLFPNNKLATIDTATGTGTIVGTVAPALNPNGIGFRFGKLYTFNTNGGPFLDTSCQLDPATGNFLGSTSVGAFPPFGWNGGGLAFRSDGIGYLGRGTTGTDIYQFDMTAGANTKITGAASVALTAFAFSPADVLYAIDGNKLVTINQATGASTLVANVTGLVGPPPNVVTGVSFDSSGNLFACVIRQAAPFPATLYKLDTVTAAATLIGPIGINQVESIAFATGGGPPPPPPPPPPPSGGPGGGGEGSYGGSGGPAGSEGSYGFGGGVHDARPVPMLQGPFTDGPGRAKVINKSGQTPAGATTGASLPKGLGGWVLASGLFVGLLVLLKKMAA